MFLFCRFADDGRLRYKISFKKKGKIVVSGHHIAFDHMPRADQLFVGARVVVKHEANEYEEPRFCPGIVAEVPCRKNNMRFVCLIVKTFSLKKRYGLIQNLLTFFFLQVSGFY